MPKKFTINAYPESSPTRVTLYSDGGVSIKAGNSIPTIHFHPEEIRELLRILNQHLVLDSLSLLDSGDEVASGQPSDGELSEETDARG